MPLRHGREASEAWGEQQEGVERYSSLGQQGEQESEGIPDPRDNNKSLSLVRGCVLMPSVEGISAMLGGPEAEQQ